MIKVKLFGKLREKFGNEILINRREMMVEELLNLLIKRDSSLSNIKKHIIFSINHRRAVEKEKIKEGDTVSVFITPTGG